jgi:hypothetical protein
MYALNRTWDVPSDDGLEPLAPFQPVAHAPSVGHAMDGAWGPIAGAMTGVLIAALVMITGPFAVPLVYALGGTAAFAYLGTALVSARPGIALLDLAAAVIAIGITLTATGPVVSVLLVHVVWGIRRGAWPGAVPGRGFAMSWAAMHAMAALLLGFGT